MNQTSSVLIIASMSRTSEDLHLHVLQNNHDHILAGHFGQNRTLELVQRSYTWPQMREYVRHYVKLSTVCGRNKTPRHRPYGLLKPLPVPECPWDSISMDFIEQLLDSNGFTAILVVIDRASKQAIFIPTHDTINSEELARLFVIHVFSKHGVPDHITSDVAPSLSPNSRAPLLKPLTWNFTSPPDITWRPTDKRNVQTKPWNSISASIVLINRTTGIYYYLLLNLHTTMLRTPPPNLSILRQQRLPP